LAFLDEDDAFAPEPPASPRRSRGNRQQQFLVRRIFAVVAGLLIVILLLLGIKGCLDARKERNFENYASDLSSIQQQSGQLSQRFFDRFNDPGNLDQLTFPAQIAADRGTAESQLDLIRGLDTPGDVETEQAELDLAYELRAQAIAGISDQISTALGKKGSQEAENQIADYMRWFLASDVLNTRAITGINAVLKDEGIDCSSCPVPDEQFLPDPPEDWIDPGNLSSKLATIAGAAGAANCNGNTLRGTSLGTTTLGGVALTDGATTTVTGGGPLDLDIQVLNGGDATEQDITIDYKLSGGSSGQATISKLASGATGDATATIKSVPQSGATATLTVNVHAVPCEELTSNNKATYTVVFG
jgi:hypothetical protein